MTKFRPMKLLETHQQFIKCESLLHFALKNSISPRIILRVEHVRKTGNRNNLKMYVKSIASSCFASFP